MGSGKWQSKHLRSGSWGGCSPAVMTWASQARNPGSNPGSRTFLLTEYVDFYLVALLFRDNFLFVRMFPAFKYLCIRIQALVGWMAQMDETDLIYNGPWDEPLNHYFRIEGKIEIDEDALVEERRRFGRFVLASNDVNLDQELMFNYYKGPQVETVLYNI